MEPKKKDVTLGHYRKINGVWHKRCRGITHDESVYLPANDKYFYRRKDGRLLSQCRLCDLYGNAKNPEGMIHGLIPVRAVQQYYWEACNRIGLMELANRTGLHYTGISKILNGRVQHVRANNLRLVMLELVSIRRKGEYSINTGAAWRIVRRANGTNQVCVGCGTAYTNYTENCEHCQERRRKHIERGTLHRGAA